MAKNDNLKEMENMAITLDGGGISPFMSAAEIEQFQQGDRRQQVMDIKKKVKEVAHLKDEDYVKATLKKLIEQGQVVFGMLEKEIENDVDTRSVEVAAKMVDSLNNALKTYIGIGFEKRRVAVAEGGLEVSKQRIAGDHARDAFVVGTLADVLQLIHKNQQQLEEPKEIIVDARVLDPETGEPIDAN